MHFSIYKYDNFQDLFLIKPPHMAKYVSIKQND